MEDYNLTLWKKARPLGVIEHLLYGCNCEECNKKPEGELEKAILIEERHRQTVKLMHRLWNRFGRDLMNEHMGGYAFFLDGKETSDKKYHVYVSKHEIELEDAINYISSMEPKVVVHVKYIGLDKIDPNLTIVI